MRLLTLVLWVVVSTSSASAAYGEQIASYQGLTASVPDGASCGASARVTINAPDASDFRGDRVSLQNLIGGVRANFADCSKLKSLELIGYSAGVLVFSASLSARDGWQLPLDEQRQNGGLNGTERQSYRNTTQCAGHECVPNTGPAAEAESVRCDFDPSQPLIGCWLQISPDSPLNFRPAITVFTQSGRMFGGTPRQLATGQFSGAANWHRERMYGVGEIVDVRRDTGGFQQYQPPRFYDQCSIMELPAYGFETFFANILGPSLTFRLVRLNVRRITADMFDSKATLARIGKIIQEGSKADFCVDPGQPSLLDRMLLDVEKQLLHEIGSTTLPITSIAPRVKNRISSARGKPSEKGPAETEPERGPQSAGTSGRPNSYTRPEIGGSGRGRFEHVPLPTLP